MVRPQLPALFTLARYPTASGEPALRPVFAIFAGTVLQTLKPSSSSGPGTCITVSASFLGFAHPSLPT
ncbi:hypothetical protein J1614_004054 [Plenodomus biglobosus]|nr:hypothetical protein J1614_004054 [Plenodomus biglobosus]